MIKVMQFVVGILFILILLTMCSESTPPIAPENYQVIGEPLVYSDKKGVRFSIIDTGGLRTTALQRAELLRDLAASTQHELHFEDVNIFLLPDPKFKGKGYHLASVDCKKRDCTYVSSDILWTQSHTDYINALRSYEDQQYKIQKKNNIDEQTRLAGIAALSGLRLYDVKKIKNEISDHELQLMNSFEF